MRTLAALLVVIAAATAARAETLIVEMSTETVSITSNFVGTRVSLFGVIERDAMTVSRPGKYQVLAVVSGPPHTVLVQRKERMLGIWVNSAGERFHSMPSYYAVLANPAATPLLEEGRVAFPLSLDALGARPGAVDDHLAALARQRGAAGQFVEDLNGIIMMTDEFFRAEIPLPGIAEDGEYTVTVYLYGDSVLLDMHETRFVVAKVDFEQQIFDLARSSPIIYGLGVVVLALVTGYVGGVLFRRG